MAQPAAETRACASAAGGDGEELNGRKVALITGITGQFVVCRLQELSLKARTNGQAAPTKEDSLASALVA
ncbi:hypothetical protein AAES_53728 [Amazona aestiva]|uniref:Uncharacterized protein n=1 Tax=Amazona aestiva TaxID=12930 RepID=A0A0Q3MN48_AMAAE|nr:hypothetical protein AAES_53728 [Amazona aestiva]